MRRDQTSVLLTALSVSCAAAIVGFAASGVAATPDASISSNVAAPFVGEDKTVEGRVAAAQRDGNTVHLHLGTPPPDVTVSLVIGLLSDFPPAPETYYPGKTVRVSGTIRSFRGMTEIVIHDPARIQVVGEVASAPQPPATSPPVVRELPAGRPASVAAAPPAVAPPVAAPPAATPTASPTPPAAAAAAEEPSILQRLEQFTERVRLLEERVRELEAAAARRAAETGTPAPTDPSVPSAQ